MKCRIRGNGLTAAQKKICEQQVNEFVKKDIQNKILDGAKNLDAAVLLALHDEFGFGKDRLERAFKAVVNAVEYFRSYYEDDCPGEICKIKLRDKTGIDLDKLYEEMKIQ